MLAASVFFAGHTLPCLASERWDCHLKSVVRSLRLTMRSQLHRATITVYRPVWAEQPRGAEGALRSWSVRKKKNAIKDRISWYWQRDYWRHLWLFILSALVLFLTQQAFKCQVWTCEGEGEPSVAPCHIQFDTDECERHKCSGIKCHSRRRVIWYEEESVSLAGRAPGATRFQVSNPSCQVPVFFFVLALCHQSASF